jgi:DNA-binding LytR/AlgR family response regulator
MVEDNDQAASALSAHLEHFGAERGVRFLVTRLSTAFDLSSASAVDLIFMDIDLPGINGMEAAQLLREENASTPLIFVTNLAQYAVRGYQVDALDFMVKPVSYGDFAMRMERALRVMEKNAAHTMVLPTANGTRIVNVNDITHVELVKHDLLYHVVGFDQPLRRRGSISGAREELPQGLFITVSQGCFANMAHVTAVLGDSIRLDDGTQLFFSRSRKKPSLETLARYFGGTI